MATGGQSACDALAAAAADEVPPGLGPLAYALACASHTYSLAVLTLFSPIPLYWHAPLHLASTASMVWGARRLCATPLLQSPLAERLFRQLQLALRPLQLLVPVPLLPPPLDAPPDLCAASVSWLQVGWGGRGSSLRTTCQLGLQSAITSVPSMIPKLAWSLACTFHCAGRPSCFLSSHSTSSPVQVVLCFILPIYLRLRWDIRAMLQRAQQEGRALPSPSR